MFDKSFWISFRLKSYIVFILSNILLYMSYYEGAKRMNWELEIKNQSIHYKNITNLILYSSILYIFGNYDKRWDWSMFSSTFLAMFGFGYLAQQKFLKTSLQPNLVKTWKPETKFFFMNVIGLVLIIAIYHLILAHRKGIFGEYLSFFLVLFSIYLIIPWMMYKHGKASVFHPHHWMIFWLLALFTRFDDTFSRISASVCLGIFIQGSAMYTNDGFLGSIFD